MPSSTPRRVSPRVRLIVGCAIVIVVAAFALLAWTRSADTSPLRTQPARVPDTAPCTCAASVSPPDPEPFPALKFPILPTSLLPFPRPLKVTPQRPGCLTPA